MSGYTGARSELNAIIRNLSNAIKQNAGINFALELENIKNDIKGTTFRVYLDTNQEDVSADLITATYLRILATGYPVLTGGYNKAVGVFSPTPDSKLSNAAEIEAFFAEMLASPDSALLRAIGFALRKKVK